MSVIERNGEILPDYTDKANGNAPRMPGYDRVIPHEQYPSVANTGNSLPGVHIEEVDDFDPARGLTREEARGLNEAATQARGGAPVDPDTLR